MNTRLALIFILTLLFSSSVLAYGYGSSGGGMFTFGLGGSSVSSEQKDVNKLRADANTREGGLSVSDLDSALEINGIIQLRIPSSIIGFQIRPSYFMQSEEGDGYEYSTNGMNFAGYLKLYPMESDFMRVFFQMGVLWGSLDTLIKEDDFQVKASGSNLGYAGGVGFEIFFDSHTIFLEAGWRFLPIQQNIVSSMSGTKLNDDLTQVTDNSELEYQNKDLETNMSGVQLMLGYGISF